VITGMPNYPAGKILAGYRGKWKLTEYVGEIKVSRYWLYPSHSTNPFARLFTMLSLALMVLLSLPDVRRSRPDWILVQHPPVALPMVAWLAAKLSGAKLALNFSDLWPQAIEALHLKFLKPFHKTLLRYNQWLCERADLLVAQNQEIADFLQRENPEKPIILMRTAVDCERFRPMQKAPDQQGEPVKIIYGGVLGMAHGMLQVCQQVDFRGLGAELHIYGSGCERKQIATFLNRYPERGIYLHAPVRPSQMPQLLQQYDVALVAQRHRVFGSVPSKLYEAMATGLPVLFLGTGEGAAIVEQYGCGLTAAPVHELPHISKTVEALLNCNDRYQMGANGRKAAIKHFNREQHFGFLINFLQNTSGMRKGLLFKLSNNEEHLKHRDKIEYLPS